jgi:hypothetical protein
MAAMGFATARGVIRYREPRDDDDSGTGGHVESTSRFWFRAPDSWRVEDERGVVHVQDATWFFLRDAEGRLQRMPRAMTSWHFGDGHPTELLGTAEDRGRRFTDADDFSVPLHPGVAVLVAGRRAWEYVLAPPARKPYPLRVTVDDETGAVLRMAVPEADSVVEMTEFEPDVPVEDALFTWDGPAATDWMAEREDDARAQKWLRDRRLPVPRWWPAGVGHMALSGDPDTGAYVVSLDVRNSALLARWPIGGTPPQHWQSRTEGEHVHAWSDATWQWELAVEQPLSPDDLARVVHSIPPDEA